MNKNGLPQKKPQSKESRAGCPLVSVIIPFYNCKRHLAFSIESVLNQDYGPIELIAVDDGSTDGSELIAKNHTNVTLLRQAKKGVSAARNLGISHANGQYIAFLDADDLWLENKIRKQVQFLKKNPEFRVVICKFIGIFDESDSPPPWLDRKVFMKERFGYIPSCILSKAEVFEKAGIFDEKYQTGEDLDWLSRVKDARLNIGKIDKVLVHKRYHGHNLSYRDLQNKRHLLDIFRSSIKRKGLFPDEK